MTVRRHLARLFADRWAVGQPAPLAWKPVEHRVYVVPQAMLDQLKRCEAVRRIPSLYAD